MHKTSKSTRFGIWWKLLAVMLGFGYMISSVIAYDPVVYQPNLAPTQTSPSFQKELETEVALSAQKVWNNVLAFMQEGIKSDSAQEKPLPQPEIPSPKPAFQFIPSLMSTSETAVLPAFGDIETDANKASIETLASIGIFKAGENGKFYPHNFVRCSDFIRVMTDVYRYKLGYAVDSENGYISHTTFTDPSLSPALLKKLNTAKALGLLEKMENLTLDAMITPVQAKQIINNTLDLNPYIGQRELVNQIQTLNPHLTKSEMAGYLAHIFQLEKARDPLVFNDISNHKYQASITKLAQLGVVAGRNGNFYPDNLVLRSDGIMMIANSLLAAKKEPLSISTFSHINTINDTTYFAPYAPHLEYLLKNEIGNSLLYPQQSGYVFLPHAQLTQGEAYTLLSQAARVKLLNMDAGSSARALTRGELADLIVQAFDLNQSMSTFQSRTGIPPEPANHFAVRREEKKGMFIAFLKDLVNTL